MRSCALARDVCARDSKRLLLLRPVIGRTEEPPSTRNKSLRGTRGKGVFWQPGMRSARQTRVSCDRDQPARAHTSIGGGLRSRVCWEMTQAALAAARRTSQPPDYKQT